VHYIRLPLTRPGSREALANPDFEELSDEAAQA
jgi:hypothetical protein